ncbi:MAG: protein kinase, partial [Candidatus Hydrogenedentes bacterium]|nr:protein kinase [Candidatus Hydrogenedentota bacterium]
MAPFAGHLLVERFRLVRLLGRGGLGAVWLGEDVQLDDEPVACKILKSALYDDRRAVSDLKREVLLTRRLRHPHILAVYTFWETEEYRLITMEYIKGSNLSERLLERGCPFLPTELLGWLGQIGQALDYAHSEDILHRDVKPANIMVDEQGRIRLADFGIARTAREVQARLTGELTSGTLLYVSPEQLMGERLDARSDLYSLAATIYELLSGTPPFSSGSIITQIQMKPAPPIEGLPDPINQVLLKALAKDPNRRHNTCGAFCDALTAAIQDVGVGEGEHQSELFPQLQEAYEEAIQEATVALEKQDTATFRMRLGTLLIEAHLLTDNQLVQALEIQKVEQKRLGEILIDHLGLTEEGIGRALARQIQLPYWAPLPLEEIDRGVANRITPELARNRSCLPLHETELGLTVAMADPLDMQTLNEL